MQYVLLTNQFGGLNTYASPNKVGPGGAVEATGIDVTSGSLQNRWGHVVPPTSNGVWSTASQATAYDTYVPESSKTIAPWGVGAIGMTERYAVARFGGRLYRSHKGFGSFPSDLNGIQYTSNTSTPPTWDFLGLMAPQPLGTPTTSSTSGVPPGDITYYCTFYNALGQESPPATSTTITLSSAKNVTVTLPQAYTTASTTINSPTIVVADTGPLRLGMRLAAVSGTIQADSYITGISGFNVTLSKNAQSTSTSVKIIDAQVVGTRLYRMGAGIETPLLVTTTSNLTTASYVDTKANADLGEAIQTVGTSNMPNGLRDVSISPSGVLFCASSENTVTYFSLITKGMYDPSKVIKVSDSPLATIYALNRFVCPTIRGAFTVTIDDAILGLPIVQTIDDTEPCQVSYYVYMADVGGAVWWNTNKGVVSTDGNTIQIVTQYTFSKATASAMAKAYGADSFAGNYFLYAEDAAGAASLYIFRPEFGWSVVSATASKSSPGTLGFHVGTGTLLYTGETASPTGIRQLFASSGRKEVGAYKTGDWTGEKLSALKKFRKVEAVYQGTISVQPYVDGTAVGPVLTDPNATMTRRSWWLPAGTKGRAISLRVTLDTAAAEVNELGVWVGEQREAMP